MSRLDAGHDDIVKKPMDPVRIVLEIFEEQSEFARGMGTVLSMDPLDQPIPSLIGDGTRVRQILLNLVGNAIKFTRDGQVSIGLDYDAERSELTVSVTDNGIGIAPDDIDRIFDDFVTLDSSYARAAEGTGLGLAIARRLVQAMGGEIGVESDLGDGSAFWFRIPANPTMAKAGPDDQSHRLALNDTPALQVLVVEDNQINRRVAREMLVNLGNTVTEAENGLLGVDAAERMQFDMILMDISMPELDGVEATQRIRAGDGPNAATPIIALTAHVLPSDLERFRNAGMTDAISKPISQARLGATIAALHASAPLPKAEDHYEPTDTVMDLSVLKELKQAIGDQTFATMQAQFLSETTEALDDLKAKDLGKIDLSAHAEAVHKLAGSAAIFGATRLRASLSAQEYAAQLGNRDDVQAGLDQVLAAWEDTKNLIAQVGREAATS